MSAESQVEATIAAAREMAQDAATAAQSYADAAQTAAQGFYNSNISVSTCADVCDIPQPVKQDIPLNIEDIFDRVFDAQLQRTDADVKAKFVEYVTEFFPDYYDLNDKLLTYLYDVIENSTTGITPAYEDAVWQRARERELQELSRAKDEMMNEFSGRGFTVPNGLVNGALLELHQKTIDTSATHAREVAIKHLETTIEMVKFATEQARLLQESTVRAVVDYIKAYVDSIRLGIDKATALVQAYDILYRNAYDYYKTYIMWGEMVLKRGELGLQADINDAKIGVESHVRHLDQRVQAAVAGANAMGELAQAALNSQNSVATISHSTNASE